MLTNNGIPGNLMLDRPWNLPLDLFQNGSYGDWQMKDEYIGDIRAIDDDPLTYVLSFIFIVIDIP